MRPSKLLRARPEDFSIDLAVALRADELDLRSRSGRYALAPVHEGLMRLGLYAPPDAPPPPPESVKRDGVATTARGAAEPIVWL